jgi:hypothetical protein
MKKHGMIQVSRCIRYILNFLPNLVEINLDHVKTNPVTTNNVLHQIIRRWHDFKRLHWKGVRRRALRFSLDAVYKLKRAVHWQCSFARPRVAIPMMLSSPRKLEGISIKGVSWNMKNNRGRVHGQPLPLTQEMRNKFVRNSALQAWNGFKATWQSKTLPHLSKNAPKLR